MRIIMPYGLFLLGLGLGCLLAVAGRRDSSRDECSELSDPHFDAAYAQYQQGYQDGRNREARWHANLEAAERELAGEDEGSR